VQAAFWVHIAKGFGVVFLVVLFFFGIYHITRIDALTIDTITVTGGETISHEEVRARAETILAESYIKIIPKRFTYMYPEEQIVAYVSKIPRIYNVMVERVSNTELSITFDEYMPYALWCLYDAPDTPCLFMDDAGYAFAEAPQLHGGALIRYYAESPTQMTQGQAVKTDLITRMQSFIEMVERELEFKIVSVLIKQNGDIECTVGGGGVFLITAQKDMNVTFENLKTVLASDAYAHIEAGNFKYIDVRFDNKVFVNEVLTPTSTSTDEMLATEPVSPSAPTVASEPNISDDVQVLTTTASSSDEEGVMMMTVPVDDTGTSSESLPE
jgi:hypothetical protein